MEVLQRCNNETLFNDLKKNKNEHLQFKNKIMNKKRNHTVRHYCTV